MSTDRLRNLIPAVIVAGVLAFSYFAPALGFTPPPVRDSSGVNCGRFGYGYHGGKHMFVCPHATFPPPAGPVFPPATAPPQGAAPVRANPPVALVSAPTVRATTRAAASMAWRRRIIADTLVIAGTLGNLPLDPVTASRVVAGLTQ